MLVPVAEKVGVCPETGLLFASFRVMVTVDVAEPSATTGVVPLMDELAATAPPEVKVTVPPVFEIGAVMFKVFTSATVEVMVQVAIPEASVAEQDP